MSTKKTYWLFCDGCKNQFVETGETIKIVRKLAAKAGWAYSKFSGDKCETCVQSDYEDWKSSVQGSVEHV